MTGLGVDMESLSVRVIKHSQKNLNIKNGNERFPCKAKFYYIRHKNCDLITKIDNMKWKCFDNVDQLKSTKVQSKN